MRNPVDTERISDDFEDHLNRTPPSQAPGIDLLVAINSAVRAAEDGVVTHVRYSKKGGLYVWIMHDRSALPEEYKPEAVTVRTLYSHLFSVVVGVYQKVERGQLIAISGQSGQVTGPHLHFSVRVGQEYVDPLEVIE